MREFSINRVAARPTVGIVVAMTTARVIGCDGRIPWNLPEELRLFRQLTTGGTVIMGRRTFESLPSPLTGRCNIVVSRSNRRYPGTEAAPDLKSALQLASDLGRPIYVIGGTELYRAALPLADTLHISWIEGDFPGDRYFPEFDAGKWREIARRQMVGFCHITYRRS